MRYEPGVAHYVMGGVLACAAVYVLVAPRVSLDPRWLSFIAGAYVGLSLGSFLRILWREEHGTGAGSKRISHARTAERRTTVHADCATRGY